MLFLNWSKICVPVETTNRNNILYLMFLFYPAPTNAENNIQMSITDGGSISVGDDFAVVCSTEQKVHLFFKLNISTPIPNVSFQSVNYNAYKYKRNKITYTMICSFNEVIISSF